jgi:(p)ppGpp synthase/HD superfamily hydrolase
MIFSDRFSEALGFAIGLHNDQVRKGTKTPYMAHLLAVTAILLENGGDEDQTIGALLLDTAEDKGGGVKAFLKSKSGLEGAFPE